MEEFSLRYRHVAEWHRQTLTVGTVAQSPLVAGSVYSLQPSGVNNNQQFGQGCEICLGAWLVFQSVTGNTYVIEDHPNGYIWVCLPDGADRDIKSNGCIKIISVKDSSAEPTGFFFVPDGKTAYVNIQHSNDGNMQLLDDYGTDDLLKITGFKVKKD